MKLTKCSLALCFCLALALTSCANKEQSESNEAAAPPVNAEKAPATSDPTDLPARYKTPVYVTSQDEASGEDLAQSDEFEIKVGADIRSTAGPQPLWDIMKRLANLKGYTVSWASDVNQNSLVDVDINGKDNFFEAIDNLLRQVDYYQEVKGKTIYVNYKETRVYRIALPLMKGKYNTTVGGNFLADRDAATGTEGVVKITSDENEYDVWANIKLNLDTILEVWSVRREKETIGQDKVGGDAAEQSRTVGQTESGSQSAQTQSEGGQGDEGKVSAEGEGKTEKVAKGYYTVDEQVGLITVTAPRPLLEKVDLYINNLRDELGRQVMIEAKIIEVYLQDNSRIGLDWSNVLKDFNITGTTIFGSDGSDGITTPGQVYPWVPAEGEADSVTTFVSKITLDPLNFKVLLNALNEQGDAHVLSNPKLTVMNGQPAVISVGKDIAYIKTSTKDVEVSNGVRTTTYSAEVDNVVEGVALGVMASIENDKKVTLHLTPITTDLIGDEIEYKQWGDENLVVGLPVVGIREMSTMVEVENGEMLIIGGLIDSVESTDGNFMPIVGEIPFVRYLFGVEEKIMQKRELVILLTPKII